MSFDYSDPIIWKMRSGSPEDPYVSIEQNVPIDDFGKATIDEVPDAMNGVIVTSTGKAWYEIKNGIPNGSQFKVDYNGNSIQFAAENKGVVVNVKYFGRGAKFISHKQVYTGSSNGNVTETLDVFMGNLKDSTISEVESAASNFKSEMQSTINEAKSSTINANNSAENADVKGTYAKEQGDYAQEKGDYAGTKAQYAQDIADQVNVQSRFIRKSPVANYSDINTTYPTPEVGWVVTTTSDGKVYRYDGVEWKHIDSVPSTITSSIVGDLGEKENLTTINKNTIVDALNEVKSTVDDYFWIKSYDSGIVINHNLGDYPMVTVVANDSTGHGGYGEYAIGSSYQVLNKVEYLSENSIRLHLFQSETFNGTPSVTGSGLRYQCSFSDDTTLTILLFQSSPTYL